MTRPHRRVRTITGDYGEEVLDHYRRSPRLREYGARVDVVPSQLAGGDDHLSDVCPYGRLKTPRQISAETDRRWAYIPDGTKRQAATEVWQFIDDIGIEKFCKWNDDQSDKDWGIPNELEVEREKNLPKLYATVTGAARLTDVKYRFFLTAVNNTDASRDTEWTCRFFNVGKVVVKEWKVPIPKVEAHRRVITAQTVVLDANADTVVCD